MIDLNELTRNSLTTAYKEEVGVLFKTLVANLSGGQSGEEAGTEFTRGLRLAQEAYAKAEKLIP